MVARREARSGAMKRGDFLERRLGLIRERVERGDYVISFTHTEKLRERKIGAEDIEEAIRNGVIIEDYPDDPKGPSGLILGRSRGRTLCRVRSARRRADLDHYGVRAGPRRMGVRLPDAQEVHSSC
jgi:Domain of unknown function (DUF4258)